MSSIFYISCFSRSNFIITFMHKYHLKLHNSRPATFLQCNLPKWLDSYTGVASLCSTLLQIFHLASIIRTNNLAFFIAIIKSRIFIGNFSPVSMLTAGLAITYHYRVALRKILPIVCRSSMMRCFYNLIMNIFYLRLNFLYLWPWNISRHQKVCL